MLDKGLAVGRNDSRRFLPAMLQRVKSQVDEVGGLGMAVDAEDAALVVEGVAFGLFGEELVGFQSWPPSLRGIACS